MRFLRVLTLLCVVFALATSATAATGNLPTSNLSLAGVKPVVHNNELYLFYLKGDFFNTPACKIAYTRSFDGVTWNGAETVINLPYCVKSDDFAAASFNGNIYLFARQDGTGNVNYFYLDYAGVWQTGGSAGSGDRFDVTVFNSRLYFFWGEYGGTWMRNKSMNTSGVWSANTRWSDDETYYGVAAAPFGTRLYQLWAGNSGTYKKLWAGYLSGTTWGGRQNIDSGDFPLTSSAPDAVEHNGKLYVAYNGSYDKTKIYYKALNGSYTWENEVELVAGSNQYYRPGIVSFNGQLFIFFTYSTGGNISYHSFYL
jgi:hypothetical protein